MQNSFVNHIKKTFPFLNSGKLLVAISGGLDSVVLAHLCNNLKLNSALAHCNFNLRGKESDADEDFVLQLAEDLDLEVFIERFETETYAEQNKLSTQMAARELRYNWFQGLAEQLDFDYILTAHHANDNLETFLINLSRGTGLDGLIGIPEVNGNVVRPLLKFSRQDIEDYAKENNINWRDDSSNASTKYLRNKLRHDVIPILKEINPQFLQNFENTQKHLQDSKALIEDRIEEVSNVLIESISEEQIQFNIAEIQKLNNPKAYLYELLKDYGFTEWNDVLNLLDAQSGKQVFSETHRLLKDREFLLITEILNNVILNQSEESLLISKDDKEVETQLGVLHFQATKHINKLNESTIYVDKALLKFPLIVRQWKKGDYFYPLGMRGKKKLSKYFKDEKLSLIDKENVWLLCSGEDIVWVINRRADNRFKVTENTTQILKIQLQ